MIKIVPTSSIRSVARTQKSGASSALFKTDSRQAAGGSSVSDVNAAHTLSALIALQGFDADRDGDSSDKRSIAWSHRALDLLEQVQRSLVDGDASIATLQRLSQMLSSQQVEASALPPPLKEIQAQILVRARVELAKRGISTP